VAADANGAIEHPASRIKHRHFNLLDSADYAADTNGIDLERGAANPCSSWPAAARPRSLGGKSMKRTLVVLVLAVLSTAGCRAINVNDRYGNYGCGDACGDSCGDACGDACDQPCHVARSQHAPRPVGEGYYGGRGGNLQDGGCGCGLCSNCCLFRRNCGHNCGPGYGPGPYDCSPCNAKGAWGCSGHRHPHGYVTGHECYCEDQPTQPLHAGICGNGYCCFCGQPAPSCCCCLNSGDQIYNFNPGPPVAQTAYPYYTVRGPRDFLLDNPPPLGPY
jgi:hypothetical protein